MPTISTAPPPVPVPTAVPGLPELPVPVPPVPTVLPPAVTRITQSLIDRINQFAFPVNNSAPAPACKKQGNFTTGGESTRYPHVRAK